jgi:hypothetical protein
MASARADLPLAVGPATIRAGASRTGGRGEACGGAGVGSCGRAGVGSGEGRAVTFFLIQKDREARSAFGCQPGHTCASSLRGHGRQHNPGAGGHHTLTVITGPRPGDLPSPSAGKDGPATSRDNVLEPGPDVFCVPCFNNVWYYCSSSISTYIGLSEPPL